MVPSISIRNDLLKSIYMGMLETLGVEDTRNFWQRHPLTLTNQKLNESTLLQHIWDESAQSPLEYLVHILESLEPFLLENAKKGQGKSVAVEEFVDKISFWGNQGTFLNARFVLNMINPFFSRFISQSDAISVLLWLTEKIGKLLVHGLSFPVLKSEKIAESKHVYTMIRVEALLNKQLKPWDGYLYSAKLLKVAPKGLGLPAFDTVELLSDARTVQMVVFEDQTECKDDAFFINGQRMGTILTFSAFCDSRKLNIKSYSLPHCKGVEIERDYRCPKRRRVVLRQGCFYGADVYLFKIVYALKKPKKDHFLFHFIREATQEDLPAWAELKNTHLALVESVREYVLFEYRMNVESIFVAGRELIKGKAAKILRHILKLHQEQGRTEFTFQEFKYEKTLFHSHKDKGFETYLERLVHALEKTGYSISIKKHGDGKFTLITGCRIGFQEVTDQMASIDSHH